MTIKLTNEIFEQHYVDATDVDKATSSDSYFTFNYILKNMSKFSKKLCTYAGNIYIMS